MLTRLKAALPLIALVLLAFLSPVPWGGIFFSILAAGMLIGGILEACSMSPEPLNRIDKILAIVGSAVLAFCSIWVYPDTAGLPLGIGVYFFIASCLLLYRGPTKQNILIWMSSLAIFLYMGWTLSYLIKLYFIDPKYLLFLLAITKMGDVGAYFIGSSSAKLPWGNHKIAPTISPKKSWEGLVGGTLFSVGTAWLLKGLVPFELVELIILGILAGVIGLIGDLVESALKRTADLKDSGKIPGIGGVLDVLDSLVFMGPIFYLFLIFTKRG